MDICYLETYPNPDEYICLRRAVDFSPRSIQAVQKGLPGSSWAVTARYDGRAVGMARLVGDGGCSFLVVDVIVLPEFQGMGIGSKMMQLMDSWINENVPPGAMISMLADEPGRKLYERYGFDYTAPESVAMKRCVAGRNE